LILKEEIKGIRSAPNKAKDLQAKLSNLSKEGKLQLLEYEWNLLPVERIKISIVTDRVSKDFSYNF
jgi:hypothetical protein